MFTSPLVKREKHKPLFIRLYFLSGTQKRPSKWMEPFYFYLWNNHFFHWSSLSTHEIKVKQRQGNNNFKTITLHFSQSSSQFNFEIGRFNLLLSPFFLLCSLSISPFTIKNYILSSTQIDYLFLSLFNQKNWFFICHRSTSYLSLSLFNQKIKKKLKWIYDFLKCFYSYGIRRDRVRKQFSFSSIPSLFNFFKLLQLPIK